jgi:hypothetical protein
VIDNVAYLARRPYWRVAGQGIQEASESNEDDRLREYTIVGNGPEEQSSHWFTTDRSP